MTANLFVAGRIIWRADLKQTKKGTPMRSVLIAGDDENMPPVRALVFGDDAEHAAVGDWMSVEGDPEISTYEKDGEVKPAVSLMAKWSKLSGHGGQRQRKSQAQQRTNGQQQDHRQQRAFDDELPGHMQDDPA
jgi:hypothetical protein